jgi:protein TonB
LIQKVQPIYPAEAKLNHIQGIVRFTATIGKDGTVKNLDLVMGDPILAAAAREAVQKWIYKPTLLNGDPVVVVTQIDVNFTLLE